MGLIDYHEQHIYAYHLFGLKDRSVKEIGSAKKGSNKKARYLYQNGIIEVFRRALNSMPKGGRLINELGIEYRKRIYKEFLCIEPPRDAFNWKL